MKQRIRALALVLGSAFALSVFAACTPQEEELETPSGDAASSVRICYDNLGGGYLDEAYTRVSIAGASVVAGYNASGREVDDASSIATYENGVFTAVSAGTVVYRSAAGELGTVEVVPAYVTDPGNQYSGTDRDFQETGDDGEKVLGNTHDPSLIEVKDEDGLSVYYIFSTGWNIPSDAMSGPMMDEDTYGNAIHVSYDGMKTWMFLGRTFDYSTRDDDFVNARSGQWLYTEGGTPQETARPSTGGSDSAYSSASASWWAPDIVEKPDGSGYWLYTCVVDGAGNSSGMLIDGEHYARACILLYESESLEPGTFKPVLDANGDPAVLMQSTIPRGADQPLDVNGIDPQIIYDTEGYMYMAYGSFGSGNYMVELDPATGLRKDGMGWQTHDDIRSWIENDIQALYRGDDVEGANDESGKSIGWTHDYYGTNISKLNMEAPVIARHDNVTTMDADGNILEENKTYYYSMHSYDGLADNYQMWGGRSESVWGIYKSTTGGIVYNAGVANASNEGNKYMGGFRWESKSATSTEYDFMLPGHNDLFTSTAGVSVAAYIMRRSGDDNQFVTQLHQYYLNSYGEIVINPNRYAGEADRAVSAQELFAYTDGGKFKMVVMVNNADSTNTSWTSKNETVYNVSRDVVLTQNADDENSGTITDGGTVIGTWKMYGNGYIKFTFTETLKGTGGRDSGETVYYGVVRPAWLSDQNRSGFTITCLGQTEGNVRSMSMFMNNYSTITGDSLVGE